MVDSDEHSTQSESCQQTVFATLDDLRPILADGVTRHRAQQHEEDSYHPKGHIIRWGFCPCRLAFCLIRVSAASVCTTSQTASDCSSKPTGSRLSKRDGRP